MQLDCFLSIGVGKCFPLIKRGEMFFHVAWVGSTPGGGDSHCSVDLPLDRLYSLEQLMFHLFLNDVVSFDEHPYCLARWPCSCALPASVCGFHKSYLSSRKTGVLSLSSPERLCLPSIVSGSVLNSVVTGAFPDRRLRKWNLKKMT